MAWIDITGPTFWDSVDYDFGPEGYPGTRTWDGAQWIVTGHVGAGADFYLFPLAPAAAVAGITQMRLTLVFTASCVQNSGTSDIFAGVCSNAGHGFGVPPTVLAGTSVTAGVPVAFTFPFSGPLILPSNPGGGVHSDGTLINAYSQDPEDLTFYSNSFTAAITKIEVSGDPPPSAFWEELTNCAEMDL